MRTPRARTAAAACVLLALSAPSAAANSGTGTGTGNIVVAPAVTTRDEPVTVTVHAASCRTGSASSPAFGETPLTPQADGAGGHATPAVARDVAPGSYDITVTCEDGRSVTRTAAFTVINGAVRGGDGPAPSEGTSTADLVIGGLMVASALIGGGVLWLRGEGREDRPTG
ncbi:MULTISPECIES: hypothetical protein [Streptomyces]|uniref:Uncharacterized protein n=1 Tax=Streptomyces fungicidicus TaxID=68203 RepID=A0ACC7XZQ3_9ACTN|nr:MULTISPECIES: hypothetical protein [Streptomyces]MBF4137827.1 hypothetical protein [Streptomyces albidoflavus]NUV75090.1 hypothetical protein [Streptomyces fungicidicus]PAX82067.1 hypothetical protein CLM81_29935 [Streptomyces albidoflavus]PAX91839.1 hypothetical protein CLM82_07025 [Streptomyces albidoflavus]PBO15180.1 hypothetical protein CLM83_31675 [Streptomyces albidoflavus]